MSKVRFTQSVRFCGQQETRKIVAKTDQYDDVNLTLIESCTHGNERANIERP